MTDPLSESTAYGWWVADPKETLAPEEAYNMALGAISSVVSFSSMVLGALAIIMAVIAFFGWTVIYSSSKAAARKVSKNSTDAYLSSEAFQAILKEKITAALDERLVVESVSSNEDVDDADPFPEAEAFPSDDQVRRADHVTSDATAHITP